MAITSLFLLAAAGLSDPLACDSLPTARFAFGGPLGERIERDVGAWLLPAPTANPGMLEMLRTRDRKPEPQLVPWAGEFAGKYLTSAVLALRMTREPDLERCVARFVDDLISTQAEDGYLGPFPARDRLLGNWDLWGHYHVMLGLLLWHERTGSRPVLDACIRAADLICRTYLDGSRRVFDAGSHEMNMAVIHVLGALYRKTSNERYLRLLREIERDWERAGDYLRAGMAGVDFYKTPRPRWESLHDLQGLVELYRITGDSRYRAAFVNLWRSIAALDVHNTGGFSSGEQAVGHPYSPEPIETCCTIAWMALSVDMLRLTLDAAAADALELSTLNAMAGAQHPSGRWWTYNTPMDGVREASAHSIAFQARAGTPELNCCSVNGPRGLGMLAEWAVMADREGLVINFFGPMKADVALQDGTGVVIEEATEYPAGSGEVVIAVRPERPAKFALKLRKPGWDPAARFTHSAELTSRDIAGYRVIEGEWKGRREVRIALDMKLRAAAGERRLRGRASLFRGPILLAYDQRWNAFDEDSIPQLDLRTLVGARMPLLPGESGVLAPWMKAGVRGVDGRELVLCDFASAGAAGTRYRTWLPAVNFERPQLVLLRPRSGEVVPAAGILFRWEADAAAEDRIEIVSAGRQERPLVARGTGAGRFFLAGPLEPGDMEWRVIRPGGESTAMQRFIVDAALPPRLEPPPDPPPAPGPRADGVLIEAPLRGSAEPRYGRIIDSAGVEASADGAVLDGERGRIRFALRAFPSRDYAVVARVRVRAFPQGRIAQVASAWTGPMDDPLRIVVEGGKVSARIEARAAYATPPVPVEAGKWFHVAAVKTGNKLTLFVDGEARASADVPEEVDSEARSVGVGGNPNFGGNEFLAATIADFAVYARALSGEEVHRLAERR